MVTNNAINSKNPFVQIVSTATSAVQSITTVMPADDTIPQNTEGDEVLTLSITPKFSTSILEITFSSFIVKSTAGSFQVALFQDSGADAIAAKSFTALPDAGCLSGAFQHVMTSGTTSSTTFKIRVGPAANSCIINGIAGGTRRFGGVASTLLTIIEHL